MDDIIRAVAQRTGLSEDQAGQAVDMTVSMLKQRLPEPARSMLDQVMGQPGPGAVGEEQAVEEAADQPSGKFGQATEAVKDIFKR